MTALPDWVAWEERIAALLPGADEANRARLLDELTDYAQAVVACARRAPISPDEESIARARAWLDRPVFVCGHHRSGTTLLANLLDGHPQLVVLPSEGTYLTSFRYVAQRAPSSADVDRFAADWVARFVDPNYEPHFVLGRSRLDDNPSVRFVQSLTGSLPALRSTFPALEPFAPLLALLFAVQATLATRPRTEKVALWVEKTPLNEQHVMRLAAFPRARFIQLVRDPGATLASQLRSVGEAESDARRSRRVVVEHAASIGRSLRLARRNARLLGDRYLVVRYEDLAGRPAREMDRVCAFLEIAPHAALTTPTVAGRPVRANSSFLDAAPGVVVRPRGAPKLSPFESRAVAALATMAARRLGYDAPALPLAGRAAARIVVDTVRLAAAIRRRLRLPVAILRRFH